jgi:endoglucanase
MKRYGEVTLGGGPSLTHGSANHIEIVQRLIDVAEKKNIPIQHESSSRFTGTDTDMIFTQQHGIPSALVSLPLRYMHSVVEMADLRDIESVIQLLVAFAERLTDKDEFKVRL